MKISTNPAQHLSYHEVLSHFLQQKKDVDTLVSSIKLKSSRDKASAKKNYPIERDKDFPEDDPSLLEELPQGQEADLDVAFRRGMSDELVYIQEEVIKYLCSPCTSTSLQTSEGISHLADELQDYKLTKAEVLQICNLVPTERVELYAIIEEVDTRFLPSPEETLDDIGARVKNTLLDQPPNELYDYTLHLHQQEEGFDPEYLNEGDDDGVGGANAEMEAMSALAAQMVEQEYVFEQGKEGGVDDEQDGDMD